MRELEGLGERARAAAISDSSGLPGVRSLRWLFMLGALEATPLLVLFTRLRLVAVLGLGGVRRPGLGLLAVVRLLPVVRLAVVLCVMAVA